MPTEPDDLSGVVSAASESTRTTSIQAALLVKLMS